MMTDGPDTPAELPDCESGPADRQPVSRVWQSEEIFQGHEVVSIEHRGEFYQLRITRHGKLILNK